MEKKVIFYCNCGSRKGMMSALLKKLGEGIGIAVVEPSNNNHHVDEMNSPPTQLEVIIIDEPPNQDFPKLLLETVKSMNINALNDIQDIFKMDKDSKQRAMLRKIAAPVPPWSRHYKGNSSKCKGNR